MISEKFTGNLEWITMGGRLDVRHPEGQLIRTSWAYGDHYVLACELGKNAVVDVEVYDNPAIFPRVVDVRSAPSTTDRARTP